jgi:hypothetical protein
VTSKTTTQEADRPDNIVTKDVNLIRLGLNAGIGAEYNLVGSTSLVVSINYLNAFTNAVVKSSKELRATYSTGENKFTQSLKANGVALNVGFLF